jgi:heme-degrading monooxygenase HmoA
MYATLRWYSDSELAGKLKERADEIRSVISEIDGFRGYYLIESDAGTVSISLFEDEASTKQSNEAAASWLRENLPGVSADNVVGGEVVLNF